MDIRYMKRAIEISKLGSGRTNPNPLVGAVIVKDDKIIGEGFHEYLGGPHAEVNALNNAVSDVKNATMYVTLEPCSHYGRTPPCAKKIIEKGIKKVVIAMVDPNEKVAGVGIKLLNEAGIETVIGVLENEARKINEIFIKYITKKKPFVIMKTAMTLDGKIATHTKDSKWVTSEKSREYVHILRGRLGGIMVGVNTIIEDDPSLNTRLKDENGSDPVRIIVDSTGRTPLDSKVLNLDSDKETIIATSDRIQKEKLREFELKGAKIIKLDKNGKVNINSLMDELYKMEIDSILLEGGGTLNEAMLKNGLVDKVLFFIGPKIVGGKNALSPVEGEGISLMSDALNVNNIEIKSFENDILIEGYL